MKEEIEMNEVDNQRLPVSPSGLFFHYGIYSLTGSGEWVLNRERHFRQGSLLDMAWYDLTTYDMS
jgi:hypothetical protein